MTRMAKRLIIYWLPLVVWISGIFVVSSLPSGFYPAKIGFPIIPTEYLLHITAFFVLCLLFYRVLQFKNIKLGLTNVILYCLIFTMIVSFSKECLQFFIPTRSFSMKDILVDGGAAIFAMLVVSVRGGGLFIKQVSSLRSSRHAGRILE